MGHYPDKISIITSPIISHKTSIPKHPIPIPMKSNSLIFLTIDNIIVQWLCIDDVDTSTTIWAEWDFPPPIIWNVKNRFTPKTNSGLFHKMLPNKPQIIFSLQDLYDNPTQPNNQSMEFMSLIPLTTILDFYSN